MSSLALLFIFQWSAFSFGSADSHSIPPYKGATSTVNYPLMTVSKDAWTSTITVPPMTLSKLGFEVVTLVEGIHGGAAVASARGNERHDFQDFWPVPYLTLDWPVVVYRGPDGLDSTASPTVSFPTPPPSIEPGAKPPAKADGSGIERHWAGKVGL